MKQSDMNSLALLVCPHCSSPLANSGSGMYCGACDLHFPNKDGIVDLSINPDYYYGEIPQNRMLTLLEDTRRLGWRPAFEEFLMTYSPAVAEYHRRYVMLETRAAWKYLLHVPPANSVVLDVGCGWGATSLALARTFHAVASMDMTLERLHFLQARALSEGFDNVMFYRGGDGEFLPFAKETFDAVVVNGVLEWVPIGKRGNPRQLQIQFLEEIERILKPNGQLYLGIENRIGFKYFLGQVEDHTGIRFISLLPRKLADIYSRCLRKEPFRTYTYTKNGLRSLLKDSGFEAAEVYIPTKDYREFGQISKANGDWMEPHGLVNNFKRRVWHWFQASKVYPQFCLAYSVVANKERFAPALVQDILSSLAPELAGHRENGKVEILRYVVSGEDVVILEANVESVPVIAKIPLNDQADHDLEVQYNRLGQWGGQLSTGLASLLPRPLKIVHWGNTTAYIESRQHGTSGQSYLWNSKAVDTITEQAVAFLISFQRELIPGTLADKEFVREFFVERLTALEEFLISQGLQDEYARVKNFMIHTLEVGSFPIVPCHGDFWLGNVLVDNNYTISGIIDWGGSFQCGLPLIDLCEMICEGEHFRSGRRLAEVLEEYLINPDHQGYGKMESYLESFRLSHKDIRPMIVLSWMLRSSRRLAAWRRDLAFGLIDGQVMEVFPVICRFVGSEPVLGSLE